MYADQLINIPIPIPIIICFPPLSHDIYLCTVLPLLTFPSSKLGELLFGAAFSAIAYPFKALRSLLAYPFMAHTFSDILALYGQPR